MSKTNIPKGFCLFFDWVDDLDNLDGNEAWSIVKALRGFYQNGENPVDAVEKKLKATVSLMYSQIKRQQNISQIRSEAGKKGGFAKANVGNAVAKAEQNVPTITKTETNTDTDIYNNNKDLSVSISAEPPSEDECFEYFYRKSHEKPYWDALSDEYDHTGDAKRFYQYNQERGWDRAYEWKHLADLWFENLLK